MEDFQLDILKAQNNQILNLAANSDDYDLFKSWSSDLQKQFPSGGWRTINGAKVFIHNGKVVEGLDGFNGKIDEFFKQKESESKSKKKSFDVEKFNELKEKGISIDLHGVNERIIERYDERTERVRTDRYGRRNPNGRSWRTITERVPVYRDLSKDEIRAKQQEVLDKFSEKFDGFEFNELVSDFEKTIKNIPQLNSFSAKDIKFGIKENGNFSMSLYAKFEGAADGLSMERDFYINNDGKKEVYHSYFKLNRKIQGGSLMKKLFSESYKQYEKCGIESIKVNANIDVGGYAWAKTGFRAEKSEAERFLNSFESKIGNDVIIRRGDDAKYDYSTGSTRLVAKDTHVKHKVTKADVNKAKKAFKDFYKTNPETEKFPMRLFADINKGKAGKAFLLGSNWNGKIDLLIPEQKKEFTDYIKNS
jgi:hypothetical protein